MKKKFDFMCRTIKEFDIKVIGIFVMFFCFANAFSQNIKIVQGEEYHPKRSEGFFDYILDFDDNYFYVKRLSTAGSGFTQVIQKVNRKSFEIVYTMDYEYNQSNRDLVEETEVETKIVNDQIFVFTRKFNLKESIVYLLFRKFDANTGKEIGTQQSVISVECEKQSAPYIKFYTEFSKDKSKILLGSTKSNIMTVYNTKNFEKVGELTLNFSSSASYSNFNIDNSGNLICLSVENRKMALVKLQINSSVPIITTLSDNVSKLKNSNIEFEENNLYVSGLTGSMDVFCINIDLKTNQIVFNTFVPLTKEISEKLKYSFNYKEGAENKFYRFEKILVNKESLYIIQSQNFSTIFTSTSGHQSTLESERELLITKIMLTGKYEWMRLIPKFNSDKSLGFNSVGTNDNLYLFYLEHPKNNIDESIDQYDGVIYKETTGLNGCSFVCAQIDAKGTVKRKSLFINKGWCYKPINKNMINENEKSLTIKMMKGKEEERYDKLFFEQ